jgi:hypothetical protein
MPTIYDDAGRAVQQHPAASEFFHDFELLTQRGRTLVRDVINDMDRLAELQKVNKAINSSWRLFHQWRRDQISLDEMVAAVRRERLRLIP